MKLEQTIVIFQKLREYRIDSSKLVIRRTFDAYVNRPLVGNAPVRMIEFSSARDSMTLLIRIVEELDWAVCNVILKANTLGRIRRMMRPISPSPANILTRSLWLWPNLSCRSWHIRQKA
jgi:hypothetical protein